MTADGFERFATKDVLIKPTIATPAPLLGTLNANDSRTQSGLPAGVQFVARLGEEHTLLQLGRQLEEVAPWPTVAPLWSSHSKG